MSTNLIVNELALRNLGLAKQPFSDTCASYYLFSNWHNKAELIRHFVLYSHVVMYIDAEKGAGKTAFIDCLSQIQTENLQIQVLPGEHRQYLALCQYLANLAEINPTFEDKREFACKLIANAYQNEQKRLIVIDDAQNIDESSLSLIYEIAKQTSKETASIHFLLLGEGVRQIIPRLGDDWETVTQRIDFPIVNEEEAKSYLLHQFNKAYDNSNSEVSGETSELPFSTPIFKALYHSSRGNIQALGETVVRYLNQHYSGTPQVKVNKRLNMKVIALGTAVAFIGTVMLVFIIGAPSQKQMTQVVHLSKPAKVHNKPINEAQPVAKMDLSLRSDNAHESKSKRLLIVKKPKIVVKKTRKIEYLEPSLQEQQQAIAQDRKSFKRSPVLLDKVVVIPSVVKRSTVEKPQLTRVTSSNSANKKTSTGYTIQIVGSHNLQWIKSFVNKHKELNLSYYQTKHNGKLWYVVTSGQFASHKQAKDSIAMLPVVLKKQSPWVRSVTALKTTA